LPTKGAPENVDTILEANLAVAYQLSGQEEKAKAIFEQLRARPNLAEPIAKMVDDRLRRQSDPDNGSGQES
jgi:Flp pilus assembly protein TadD